MKMNELLLEIVAEVLDNNDLPKVENITMDTNLQRDLMMDSIVIAELTVRVEDRFNIDVFSDGMVHTIGDIMSKLK